MAQDSRQTRSRTRARVQRQRERSPALAAGLSVLTVFTIAVLVFVVGINLPGTALFNFWRLVTVNGQVSPSSELFLQLREEISRQDALFVFPLSLLCGGLVLGRLCPRRVSRPHLLRVAAAVPGGIIFACEAFIWGLLLWAQHGRLSEGEADRERLLVQTACALGWLAAYLLGTLGGVIWRDARPDHSKSGTEPHPLSTAPH